MLKLCVHESPHPHPGSDIKACNQRFTVRLLFPKEIWMSGMLLFSQKSSLLGALLCGRLQSVN